ncbi:hypothetical protein KAI04_04730 [Candidatus Pacearchaeota archaeon]|nr:hypothetical protein [Candidatus Pacearchaeota archaeon]
MKKQEQEKVEDEESDLEEEINISSQNSEEEETEEINEIEEDKFVDFISPSSGNFSTALGQVGVATELRATDLERDLSEAPVNNTSLGDKEDFKYNIEASSEEEAKYISSGNEIEKTIAPSSTDLMNLGKKQNLMPSEVGFSASPNTMAGTIDEPGKYELPDRFDVDKAGKGDPLTKQDVKYTPSNEY